MGTCAAAIVGLGALIQRMTGMGLALVASPFLVLVLGPVNGVKVLQVIGLAVCLISAIQLRASINYRKCCWLLLAAVVGLVPGTIVARVVPEAWLNILVGLFTLVAIASMSWLKEAKYLSGKPGLLLAGGLSGFMNVTAGIGGPPLVVYAHSSSWRYAEYVATIQLYFFGVNIFSLLGRGLPDLRLWQWILFALLAGGGLLLGTKLSGLLSERRATQMIVTIALIGALAAAGRGVAGLIG